MKTQLLITSHHKQYSVDFTESSENLLKELTQTKNSLIVIDENLLPLYSDICKILQSHSDCYFFSATEHNKSLSGLESILNFFQTSNATRATTIIAIGGGILHDVVAFAAHIFYRGLKLILVPTTLLAMCDSCIGGKCGVNFQHYKNQIGVIHPPDRVIIWPGFLTTLSHADIRSGYGEILKYTLLHDASAYEKFKQNLFREGFAHAPLMDYIHLGLSIKKKIVEEDEFDHGSRRLLNFGHTFGHALERATNYAIPHGVAVAQGIDIANYISWQQGFMHQELFEDVHALIEKYFSHDADVDLNEIIKNLNKDKKMLDAQLNLVLMEKIGKFKSWPMQLNKVSSYFNE